MLVIATLPPDGPRLLRQGGFETRLYMNPDPRTFIDAARRERLEAAHDFRNAVAPFGLIGQNDCSVVAWQPQGAAAWTRVDGHWCWSRACANHLLSQPAVGCRGGFDTRPSCIAADP